MLKNYIISILRGIRKHKLYIGINTLGLTLGLTCALLIFMIIIFEMGFNNFGPDGDRIYRIITNLTVSGESNTTAGVPYDLPGAMKMDFPELEAVSIVDFNIEKILITVTDEKGARHKFLEEKNTAYVGYDFWKIFNYEWVQGNPSRVNSRADVVVLSESMAKKFFGDEEPVGKLINVDLKKDLEVAGIVKDPPANSDFPLHIIIPQGEPNRLGWGSVSLGVQCFIKIPQNVDAASINNRMIPFLSKYLSSDELHGLDMKLQPLSLMHLDKRYGNLSDSIFTEEKIFILAIIGVMLLLVSCINFINLKTALAAGHFKEIAVRKVLGSSRFQIAARFFGETFLLVCVSIIIALVFAKVILPRLEFFTGYTLSLAQVGYVKIALFLLFTAIAVSVMAGLYPALFISKLQPENALKLGKSVGTGDFSIRKVLIVFQFIVSEVLIIGTLVVFYQLNYLNNTDMGFDKSSIVEIDIPVDDKVLLDRFKNLLLTDASVENVSCSNTGAASQGMWYGNSIIDMPGGTIDFRSQIKFIDSDFLKTYKIELITGRMLDSERSDTNYIVNQTFVKRLGLRNDYQAALGLMVNMWGLPGHIVGVVADFNTQTLEDDITSLILSSSRNIFKIAAARIKTADVKSALDNMKTVFEKVYPQYVFDYRFLDKNIENFYENETRFSRLMTTFSLISILIGCMGIFGLSAFMAFNKSKEIGIRKVLGASVSSIVSLLSIDFIKLVAAANIIAFPVAYYFMNKWLENFAYRIDMSWWFFLLSAVIAFVTALAAVSFHAVKAARANPVDSLKYE